MSIGDKPVNPIPMTTYQGLGLTYREWLIGMALSNSKLASCDIPLNESILMIVDAADAIIKQLDKEVKE